MTKVYISDDVYNPVYLPHLENTARTQIFFGGSSSGKSVFVAQRCVEDVLHGGRNYLVCRQVARTLRMSVFSEVCNVINGWGLVSLFSINKSEMLITCKNGYQIAFVGLDDVEKIKSIRPAKGAWTDLWVEEATETERNTIKQLYKRQRGGSEATPKRMTLTFNPILQNHWIYDEFFSRIGWADKQTEYKADDNSLSILKTWYIHNRFLTSDDIRGLESETDSYFFNVYTLGNWGVLGNVIFTNWKMDDLSAMRSQFVNLRNGLDFGFSSDPAAMSVTHYDKKHKTIYIFDELYETGLTNDVLADRIKDLIGTWRVDEQTKERVFVRTDPVICDSAEPKSIAELKKYGVNAYPAKKGKDSVLFGIQWLQQQTVIIDSQCVNARNEFMQYKWKEDKSGNAIREPVDKNNHLIDAVRYAYEADSSFNETTIVDDPFADW